MGLRLRLLAATAALGLGGPVAMAHATAPEPSVTAPLVVDGPPATECPNARFTSIQAAIDAAPAGGRVKVCPGLYAESVTVPKPLTLMAPRQWAGATPCPADPATDPRRYAIVDSPGYGDAFRLRADGIALRGFVAQGNLRGVVTDPAFSGYAIEHVVSQDNNIGIALSSSGALESAVERSCLRRTGVALSSFALQGARVHGNELTGNDVGMALVDGVDVDVAHNDLSDNSSVGILASLSTGVSAGHNRLAQSGSGIVYESSTGDIGFNSIEGADDTGISLVSGHDVLVRFNRLREAGVGLQLLNGWANTLRGNTIERSLGDGILLDASSNNALDGNVSRDNGRDGVRVTAQSSGNTIRRNLLPANAENDCHDDSEGAGTAGTANFWIRNFANSSQPPGLCVRW